MDLKYVPVKERSRCIILDLDGTIFRQADRWPDIRIDDPLRALLPGVKKKLAEIHMRGDFILIVTARPEPYRNMTEWQLRTAGLMWHKLLMGLPTGQRILVNDTKPGAEEGIPMAVAVNLKRDEGLEGVEI